MIKNKFQPKQNPKQTKEVPYDSLVDYELHGKLVFGFIRNEHQKKFQIENELGEFINLPTERLHFYPKKTSTSSIQALKNFSNNAKNIAFSVLLENLWNDVTETEKAISFNDLLTIYAKIIQKELSLEEYAGLRIALLYDKIYFKRDKQGFIKKNEQEIITSKQAASENLKSERERLALSLAIKKIHAGDKKTQLPECISELMHIAALGKKSEYSKAHASMIDSLCEEMKLCDFRSPIEDKCHEILTHIGYINKDANLSPIRLGRPTAFSKDEREDAEKIFQTYKTKTFNDRITLSSVNIFTIDSDSTQDFDDALSIQKDNNKITIGIHITDVSESINSDSILEATAKRRATSIYCPDETFPMLPNSLSEGVLSLKENAPRPCISFFITIDHELKPSLREIRRTLVSVTKRFSYDDVDEILEKNGNNQHEEDLKDLWAIASSLEKRRLDMGSIMFARRDLAPELDSNGKVKLVSNTDDTPARKLVSEMMILANETAAEFAYTNNLPFIYRTQAKPEGEIEALVSHIPEGPAREYARRSQLKRSEILTDAASHFSLGLSHYCQITSPIRRYLDLILMRQINNYLKDGKVTYSKEELASIVASSTEHLDEASLIQRERNRFWLLKYIEQLKISEIKGTVVKLDGPRPLVELDGLTSIFSFMPDKKLDNFQTRLKLGDVINLKITKLIPHKDKFYLQEVSVAAQGKETIE